MLNNAQKTKTGGVVGGDPRVCVCVCVIDSFPPITAAEQVGRSDTFVMYILYNVQSSCCLFLNAS